MVKVKKHFKAEDVIGQPQQENLKALSPQGTPRSPRGQLPLSRSEDTLDQGSYEGLVWQALLEAVQGGMVRGMTQAQGLPELLMFLYPHLGLSQGPVVIAREAQNGQGLGLRKEALGELAPIGREHRLRHLRGRTGKPDQAHFWQPRLTSNNLQVL
jgi:hypothetical protein